MVVELPREEVPKAHTWAAELQALRVAQARGARLEIFELELAEQLRALQGAVDRSRLYTARHVISDEDLRNLVAAAERANSLARDLLVTRQARRRTEEEISIRTRRCVQWKTTDQ